MVGHVATQDSYRRLDFETSIGAFGEVSTAGQERPQYLIYTYVPAENFGFPSSHSIVVRGFMWTGMHGCLRDLACSCFAATFYPVFQIPLFSGIAFLLQ